MFGTSSRVSYDPFEEESGERENEETLFCFTLLAQDPPGVGKSSIVASSRSSLGEEEGMLLLTKVPGGSEMSSTRVTSFMMISPSSTFKIINRLLVVTSFSLCIDALPFYDYGSFGSRFEEAIFLPFSLVSNLLLEFSQGFPAML